MNHDLVKMFKDKLSTLSDYHGLIGPGLTCYLNSVLQVLFMTPDFREAIKTRPCSDEDTLDSYLKELFFHLERDQARTDNIAEALSITDVFRQRDAAEYLDKILCLTSPEATEVFRGQLTHLTICSKCEDRSEALTCFWALPLSVEDTSPAYSMKKGVDQFFRGQMVGGDNKMYCNRCNEKTDAFMKCELSRAPDVLILLLKRFHFNSKVMRFVKLQHDVDVAHTLHVKGHTYELYASINHSGDLTGGHYTAHIRSFDTGAWYDFNDNTVELVKQPLDEAGGSAARSGTPYLLMYKKQKDGPDQSEEEEDRGAHFADSQKQEAAEEKATPPGCSPPLGDGGWGDATHDGPEWREDDLGETSTPHKSKPAKQEACTKPKSRLKSAESPMRSRDAHENRAKAEASSASSARRRQNVTETGGGKNGRETRRLFPVRAESERQLQLQPPEGTSKVTTPRQKDRRRAGHAPREPWRM